MKIGLIGGYGHISVVHYPGAELVWACDGYDRRAEERSKKLGHRCFEDAETMLREFQPDVVYVGTVFGNHGRWCADLLSRGLPVICEKPFATELADVEKIASMIRGGGPRLLAEFAMRWNPAFVRAREIIQSGKLGKIAFVQAQKTYKFGKSRPDFYRDRKTFGGIELWVAVHAIDYAAWCVGKNYVSVSATHGNLCHPGYPGMEDYSVMDYEMEGGIPCRITADFLRPAGASGHGDDRLRVTGSDGLLEVAGHRVVFSNAEGEIEETLESTDEDHVRRSSEMVSAVLGGAGSLSCRESFAMIAAGLAAREAADLGQKQEIKNFFPDLGGID
jgi:predicted dehydrogenase